jgi:CheY-like chemotaxis protein
MSGGRILVVDDSHTVLKVVDGVLNKAGYTTLCLDSGHGVVGEAVRFKPDLVLVDFAMPEVNGFDVCRALGEHEDLEGLPIVIMSTKGDPVVDKFVRTMGVVDHITKPFAPAALLAMVEHRIVKSSRQTTDQRKRPAADDAGVSPEAQRLATCLRDMDAFAKIPLEQVVAGIEQAMAMPHAVRALHDLLLARPGGPAMSGDLALVPIAEVLQLLSLQRQSGFLIARRDRGVVSIAFKDGKVRLVTGENIPRELLLGSIVVRERLMEPKDLEVLLKNRRGTRRLLGAQLVRLGYMSVDDLQAALRRQSAELVYELIRWQRGSFEFERAEQLPPEVLEFEFDLGMDELLMEGFRRVDEWGLIESAIPSFDDVPLAIPHATADRTFTDEEHQVLMAIDGRRTVQELIDVVGTGTFQVAALLYRLVAARVVSLRTQTGATLAG